MAISEGSITVPASTGTVTLKTQRNSVGPTDNPVHPIVNATGTIINPATAENQTTGNTALSAIQVAAARIPASPATEGKQDAGNASLASIAANTGAGIVNLTASPTVTAGAYTNGMVVGGKLSFSGAARANGGAGYIQNAFVAKATALSALFDLFVFHSDPVNSTFDDHAALSIAAADLNKLAGVIHCEDVVDCGTPRLIQMAGQAPLGFNLAASDTVLYVVPVIRGSETYASTSAVTVGLGIAQS
ncbi:hypothetical protein J8F10_08900 [Gemmata sp. G18]|uniref:Tail fiber protein n=1 Tax=Gemmata palustris TaxID=2822762 RepID=A0ABS5BNY6_9BACT|nr:hypothetical protein [Gemmata palustris]MBP3955397.1 hypothetical protein [Gemmata palustris]